jgi:hypothetical protein
MCQATMLEPSADGGYYIRVDHPSDLMVLDADSKSLPPSCRIHKTVGYNRTAKDWRQKGDLMFLKKKFRKALDWYAHRLPSRLNTDSSDKL